MIKKRYHITPLNEGQELNYNETLYGTYPQAEKRAKQLIVGLSLVCKDGTFTCQIMDYTKEGKDQETIIQISDELLDPVFLRGKDDFNPLTYIEESAH